MVKIFFRCQSCGTEYDPETIPYQYGYKCYCGGYVISPSGKILGRWEIDKNHSGFESAWNEFVENWSKFQKDWEGYFSQEGIKCPRVWDDVLGKMIYSTVEQFDDMLGFRFEQHLETETPVYMWPTGLRDKNGREIYEGDVVSTDLDRPFNIVVFRNGAFMFQCHDNGEDYYDYMFSADEESDRWEYGEVIGNIYENPELLKGEKNA